MKFYQHKWMLAAILGLTAALILGACDQVQLGSAKSEPTPIPTVTTGGLVTVEGRLVPVRYASLKFLTGGELDQLLVSEGQAVEKDEVLARLGKREPFEAALAQAKLEQLDAQQALDELNRTANLAHTQSEQAVIDAQHALSEAKKALNDLDTDDFQDELDDLNIKVDDAKEKLDDAKDELDKYSDLDPDNATRKDAQDAYDDALKTYDDAVYERDKKQNELDQAKSAVALATANLEEAQRQLKKQQNGPDSDKLALAQSRLDNAKAQVSAAQRSLDNLDLTAPYSGTIVDLNNLEPGENVAAGQTVAQLADFSTWIVETQDLTELDVVDIEVGQKVNVVPDALPDLELKGVVESIDRVYTERSGDILYTTRIRLDNSDPRLRWGMTVNVTFEK